MTRIEARKTLMFAHGLQHPLRDDRAAQGRRRVAQSRRSPPVIRVRELFMEGAGRRVCSRCIRTRPARRARVPSLMQGHRRTRAGVLETTFAEETRHDLFASNR